MTQTEPMDRTNEKIRCLLKSQAFNSASEFASALLAISDARNATRGQERSEEHTSELQSLMRISYAVFCFKQKITSTTRNNNPYFITIISILFIKDTKQ